MAVNLRHLFFAAQAVIPGMRARGGGSIINFGSISWHLGLADLVLYQTAKAAIEGLTRGLARELGRDNIRVNAIIPGNVQTPRQEKWYTPEGEQEIIDAQCLKARVQPRDVAAMALFLARTTRICVRDTNIGSTPAGDRNSAPGGLQEAAFCASGAHVPEVRCAPVLEIHSFRLTMNRIRCSD